MRIPPLSREAILFGLPLIIAAFIFSERLISFSALEVTQWQKEKWLRRLRLSVAQRPRNAFDSDLQGTVEKMSRLAGVKRLINLSTSESLHDFSVNLEWEGSLDSSFKFLGRLRDAGLLGRCEKLRITIGDKNRVHMGGVFDRGDGIFHSSPTVVALNPTRNVFVPLWESKQEDPILVQARELKKMDQEKEKQQAQAEAERKAHEEAERLEAKRHEMETDLVLTGIVNDGHEPLALVNSRNAGGKTLMLRSGDSVAEATITSINEARGEIRLDYQGRFQINLKIGSRSGEALQ